jgi:glycosyltransferase involved in cell wall biosynthesis
MCVARLHAQKDHVTLLRAMTRLPRSYTLVIVGDGPLRKDLHQIVSSLALTNRVIFTGILSNPYPLMQRADVIVLPSKEEGFGLVAAEAAVLGVPFVGSDVGGLGEVCALLGHRTFSAGNDEALADAIRELTSHGFKQPGTADLVARLFSPPKIAAKYLQLSSSSH